MRRVGKRSAQGAATAGRTFDELVVVVLERRALGRHRKSANRKSSRERARRCVAGLTRELSCRLLAQALLLVRKPTIAARCLAGRDDMA